jgi:hypothetical protein
MCLGSKVQRVRGADNSYYKLVILIYWRCAFGTEAEHA